MIRSGCYLVGKIIGSIILLIFATFFNIICLCGFGVLIFIVEAALYTVIPCARLLAPLTGLILGGIIGLLNK